VGCVIQCGYLTLDIGDGVTWTMVDTPSSSGLSLSLNLTQSHTTLSHTTGAFSILSPTPALEGAGEGHKGREVRELR
jgi:hypothetical protein